MFKKLNITCDEATTICDKNQYGEASVFDKIKLNLHFLGCKICALYSKQNTLLSRLYKNKRTIDQTKLGSFCMSIEEKETLRVALEKIKNS